MSDFRGQVVKHRIKLTIIRDDAKVSSPFLILNHGRGITREKNAARNVASFKTNARYFVSKGFTVFMPLRVGYGETGGPDVEFSGKCDERNFAPAYEAAAVQTIKVIEYAKGLPYIDPASGIVVGQSFGGTTADRNRSQEHCGCQGCYQFCRWRRRPPPNRSRAAMQRRADDRLVRIVRCDHKNSHALALQ